MYRFESLIVLASLALFLVTAATIPFSSKYGRGWRRWLAAFGGLLVAIGAIGFFGSSLSATGSLDWLPRSFEWPVGYATGVVSTDDGLHIVPHMPSGRIQVYNPDWSFRTSWHVDASGGTFKILPSTEGHLDVITVRGRHHYVFDITGNLLLQRTYGPESYGGYPDVGESLFVPTAPWIWPLASPFLAWVIGASGMAILFLVDKLNKQKGQLKCDSLQRQI